MALLVSKCVIPNLRSNSEANITRRPNLLGVAGTDVPLDDILKLALPYKLGVNGYSFIVSNNGFVLLHPDLRYGVLESNSQEQCS